MTRGNRVNYCSVSVREFIIIYGGFNVRLKTYYHDLGSYNTISGVWKRHQTHIELENIRLHTKVCAFANKIYICSIEYPARDILQVNSIFSFKITNSNMNTYTWSVVEQIGLRPVFKGIVHGARATNSKNMLYPHGRANESYAFSNNRAYMSGGSTPGRLICFSDIWTIDFESLEWLKLDYECMTITWLSWTKLTYTVLEDGVIVCLVSIE
ncbi:hypothetical protein RF11_12997 [Thelohanellus kitauei]|uniref:F-box associated domain-containing protein n=1 Tax=Thelohanellus kitauei TaxID=669202 RepID=A0A0C2NEQ7_THEKT|nr:hypothetical protein RF11_12997 [Thelohanellus kitauei]